MPISACCSTGLLVTALATLLLLPAQYYISKLPDKPAALPAPPPPLPDWPALDLVYVSTLDLVLTVSFLMIALFIYLCEWVQMKLMERRIVKLNQYLGASVERLRARDAQQQQLEATLKLVQEATAEYNLLLYLVLQRRQRRLADAPPPANCFFDKELGDDLDFLTNPARVA